MIYFCIFMFKTALYCNVWNVCHLGIISTASWFERYIDAGAAGVGDRVPELPADGYGLLPLAKRTWRFLVTRRPAVTYRWNDSAFGYSCRWIKTFYKLTLSTGTCNVCMYIYIYRYIFIKIIFIMKTFTWFFILWIWHLQLIDTSITNIFNLITISHYLYFIL